MKNTGPKPFKKFNFLLSYYLYFAPICLKMGNDEEEILMANLVIKDLKVSTNGIEILKGINLEINSGETHALLGPNGHGKSTLLNVIMGHPKYEVTAGSIFLDSKDILAMRVDERAKAGLFLAMQTPQEIPGVSNSDFLKAAVNAKSEKPVSLYRFIKDLETASKEVGFSLDMIHRSINEGFSGGEKKRNEMLQMMLLKPKFALIDEIDSGLDVDALRYVGEAINKMQGPEFGSIIVSHYARLYKIVQPTHVHIIVNGKIIVSGGFELVDKIDSQGYEWISKELGIEIKKEEKPKPVVLESCAVKKRR